MTEHKETKQKSIGEILHKKRQGKNLEIKKIASDLKVKIRDIEAIENGKFDSLSCNSYTLSLIRQYAKVLHVDKDLIEEKIKELPFVDNIKKNNHQLVNIGEDPDLTPSKEMFINFALISFLLFVVFLIFNNSYNKNSDEISSEVIIEKAEKMIETTQKNKEQEIVTEFVPQTEKKAEDLEPVSKTTE